MPVTAGGQAGSRFGMRMCANMSGELAVDRKHCGQSARPHPATMGTMILDVGAGRGEDAVLSALECYDIGVVLSLDRLPAGHPAIRKVTTSAGAYLLKPAWRRADIALLAELPALGAHGVRQPEVIRTRAGELVSPEGYFLQEFLAGELELKPSDAQVLAVMRAVGGLHAALSRLSASYEPDWGSVFVQVTDPGFLVAELPGLLRHYGLATRSTSTAIACLAEHQAALGGLPRQLVHGDIGPDNVLLDGERVVAIIDFTPHVLPVLFAASTALYWYHVYGQRAIAAASLAASRAVMAEARPWIAAEEELWAAGLVWEGLRRLATILEGARRASTDPGSAAGNRRVAVEAIVTLMADQQPERGGGR
jgi:Ser/Thr protein kinase RdoA (MazF antagonist)